MAFVRIKRVGEKEYRQLVENYRANGKHQQRVLAHLGKHATLEEAVEAARTKLKAVGMEKLGEAKRQRHACEEQIRYYFGEQIERYHDGQIPSREEVTERAQLRSAPRSAHFDPSFGFYTYAYEEVLVPAEVEEYRRAFGRVRERQPEDFRGVVNIYGSRFDYDGLSTFRSWLADYETIRKRVARREHVYARHKARLEKLEAVLNGGG